MRFYKQIILPVLLTALFSGCNNAVLKPSLQDTQKIDKTLPKIVFTKKGIVVDMNEVAFEWKSIKDPRVKGIYIYKNTQDGMKLYKTIDTRYSTHFVDLDVKPDSEYQYIFKVFSDDAVGVPTKTVKVVTKPPLDSVAWIYAQNGLPRMAKIIWRPHKNQRVKAYIIQRKGFDDEKWEDVGYLEGRLSAEFIDKDLKDNYIYRYRVRVKTYDDIISVPSEIVKVVTKPLPKPIKQLIASDNRPREISLAWEKSNYKDFDRYYLYRSDTIDGDYELIAKLYNNKWIDKNLGDGEKYYYKVSVVDIDGLESEATNPVMGKTLSKPVTPIISDVKLTQNGIKIIWNSSDKRIVRYKLVKVAKSGWFDTKTDVYDGIKKTTFIDKDISPNTTYIYKVYGIDRYGIESLPSQEYKIEVKDIFENNTQKSSKTHKINGSAKQKQTKAHEEQESVAPVGSEEIEAL